MLALVAEDLKSSSALWKACAKAGDVLSFEVEKKKLHEWVTAQFAQNKARAEPDAVSALIQLVGDDPAALKSEVDKLVDVGGRRAVRRARGRGARCRRTPTFRSTS